MNTRASTRRSRPTRTTLSEQVASAIQEELITSRRKPGDQLPTEPELAAQYDVSRTVVREAGRLLVERGLVDIRPGRGMVVAEFDGATISRQFSLMLELERATFEDLIELRMSIEVSMAEHAAKRRTPADLAAIDATLQEFAAPGLAQGLAVERDLDFHAAVAEAAHNPFFLAVANPINDYLRNTYQPSSGYDVAKARTLAEHTAIADAIRDQDVERAGEMARRHLTRILETRQELVAPEESP